MNYKLLQITLTLVALVFQGAQAEEMNVSQSRLPVVYMIGDSTMANKSDPDRNPMYGWGQVLQSFLPSGVVVENYAKDGRSTRSFLAEGRWEHVLETLTAGDWVIIQFGHNDQKKKQPELYTDPDTDYREFLIKFIEETREKGAQPILATSIYRRYFKQEKVYHTLGEYPRVTREVAEALDVPLVDLNQMTGELLTQYGIDGSEDLFVHLEPGENEYYPEGRHDNSHLSELGANEVAELFVGGVKALDIGFPLKD
jgi:lysophospholipase L1-like esterase